MTRLEFIITTVYFVILFIELRGIRRLLDDKKDDRR